MYSYYPELKIIDPNGGIKIVRLDKRYPNIKYSIGRYNENDIVLPDDEKKLITRIDHCILSREPGGWFVKDNSTWGTFLIRNGHQLDLKTIKDGKEYLLHEDIIKIQEWQLQFLDLDPNKTKKPSQPQLISGPYVFSVSKRSLYEMVNGQRIKINLASNEERMLCFMAQKNLDNNYKPTVCNYDELIEAVYYHHNRQPEEPKSQIQNLAKNIRKKLAKLENEDKNKWLRNESKIGYSFWIYCEN
jgi:pSer/pThr/pTyr-binding forkhead associated (FHA) protein